MSVPDLSFEEAYVRVEKILEHLNTGMVSLEESLQLYEEANVLLMSCGKQLQTAEKKIQILKKSRSGELQLDENHMPEVESFSINAVSESSEQS